MTQIVPDASPYQLAVSEQKLKWIRDRVEHANVGVRSNGDGWTYGVKAGWFDALLEEWATSYDWRQIERELNSLPQFVAEVEGRELHFLYFQGEATNDTPAVLLLHGWPYSFYTMVPLAQTLVAQGYTVVVPSLPGYIFSHSTSKRVTGLRSASQRIHQLMTQVLGHERYAIHGGDHGAVVADWLAIDHPKHILGVHCNMIGFRHFGAGYGAGETGVKNATPAEEAFVKAEVENMEKESAYFKLQATRPESISYALSDSPAGWAAYMLDKWQKWSDPTQAFESAFSHDRLITEVMLYLVSDSVATSLWAYAGFEKEPFGLSEGQTIGVPYAYSLFDDPLLPRPPQEFMEHSRTQLLQWRDHKGGGHFPMLQATETLSRDVRDFMAKLA